MSTHTLPAHVAQPLKTQPIATPDNWRELKHHRLAVFIDFGAGIDVDGLTEHMRTYGYDPDEAIVLYEGAIFDGRHKHAAAIGAGITPTFKEFVGGSPYAYIAKKLHRQHLDSSQRAMLGAEILKETRQGGEPANLPVVPPTQSQIATTLNVSERSVRDAAKVQANGTPELVQAVKNGQVSVSTAAASLPKLCRPCRVGGAKPGCKDCAKLNKPEPAKVDAPEAKAEKPKAEVKDQEDCVVPEDLIPVFEKAVDFREIINQLNAINRKLKELHEHPAGVCMRLQNAQIDLKNLKETVRFDAPYAVCPACKGIAKTRRANCPCKGRGWLVETSYKNLPQELRA